MSLYVCLAYRALVFLQLAHVTYYMEKQQMYFVWDSITAVIYCAVSGCIMGQGVNSLCLSFHVDLFTHTLAHARKYIHMQVQKTSKLTYGNKNNKIFFLSFFYVDLGVGV